jgi:hypothetical protein
MPVALLDPGAVNAKASEKAHHSTPLHGKNEGIIGLCRAPCSMFVILHGSHTGNPLCVVPRQLATQDVHLR